MINFNKLIEFLDSGLFYCILVALYALGKLDVINLGDFQFILMGMIISKPILLFFGWVRREVFK